MTSKELEASQQRREAVDQILKELREQLLAEGKSEKDVEDFIRNFS